MFLRKYLINIYIIEFKINQSAKKAIEQIKEKEYALKYGNDKRAICMIGLNFDTDKKKIEDYLIETLNPNPDKAKIEH